MTKMTKMLNVSSAIRRKGVLQKVESLWRKEAKHGKQMGTYSTLPCLLKPAQRSIQVCGSKQPKYVAARIPKYEILVYIP